MVKKYNSINMISRRFKKLKACPSCAGAGGGIVDYPLPFGDTESDFEICEECKGTGMRLYYHSTLSPYLGICECEGKAA